MRGLGLSLEGGDDSPLPLRRRPATGDKGAVRYSGSHFGATALGGTARDRIGL